MSRCPPHCCMGCREEVRQEQIIHKAEIWWRESCSARLMPEILPDLEEEDSKDADCPELVELEDRDCIFAIGLLPPATEIRAGSTISQHLAKAFKLNSEASTPPNCAIPNYLKEFKDVFSKESFDTLPEPKQWDHAVELVSGEKATYCKVYPLSLAEQKKLDEFLGENLESGHIQPSKSLMASLLNE